MVFNFGKNLRLVVLIGLVLIKIACTVMISNKNMIIDERSFSGTEAFRLVRFSSIVPLCFSLAFFAFASSSFSSLH